MVVDVLIVLLFILIGGLFAAAETAMISLREAQVRQLGRNRGRAGRTLESLVTDPAKFLATVQIGVTFATMLSSAFGAATISDSVAEWLVTRGMTAGLATTLSLVSITLVISFVSLVLGELAPKRLALQAAERVALICARPLNALATFFRPLVWLLSRTSDLVVRLFGGDPRARSEAITEDELQSIVEAHESLTGFERQVVRDVFAASDTKISEVMVSRTRLVLLPAALSVTEGARLALEHPHSRFPVMGRDSDDIVGVVHLRDLLVHVHPLGPDTTVGDLAAPVTSLPGTRSVLEAIQDLRRSGDALAVVVDEYGGTDGIVTLEDLIEEIVGEMLDGKPALPAPVGRLDGPTLVDAGLNLDDVREQTGIALRPGPYQTLAGFVIDRLGRLAVVGDSVCEDGHVFTVTDLDRRRVLAVSVAPRDDDDDEAVSEQESGRAGAESATL
jgi:putative hemolysin